MHTFNPKRFLQYARYDTLINRAFYTGAAIAVSAVILAVTVMGFCIRFLSRPSAGDIDADMAFMPDAYASVGGTAFVLSAFCLLAVTLFAGCFNHPLRSRQSRVATLTVPATNAEKFLWHTAVVALAAPLTCLAATAVADALNALLSLAAGFPADHIHSVTAAAYHLATLQLGAPGVGLPVEASFTSSGMPEGGDPTFPLPLLFLAAQFWVFTTFVFGNALKYRYNIVWTLLSHAALQFAVSVLAVVGSVFLFALYDSFSRLSADAVLWSLFLFHLLTAALMWWQSWRLYTRARVTSPLNH